MIEKRIEYLDMARGIGMLLVVIGHVEYISVNVRTFVTAFHMPLFFLISGILISQKKEEEKNFILTAKKKLKSIMVPYYIFSFLSFGIESIRIAIKGLDEWNIVFRQLFQSLCLQGVSTLWFLPALYISEIVFIGVRKKYSHTGSIIVTSSIVFFCVILNHFEAVFLQMHQESLRYQLLHDCLSMLIRDFFCVGFICAGYYLHRIMLDKSIAYCREGIICLLLATIGTIAILLNGPVDLRYMKLANILFYMIGAVSGALTVIVLCRILARIISKPIKGALEFYGRNSLIIMVTHMDFRVLYGSILLAKIISHDGSKNLFFCILIVFFVFLLEVPMIWFINRFLPFLLGKKQKSS